MSDRWIEDRGDQLWLRLRVVPRANRNAIELMADGRLRALVTVAPEDGKANAAVIKLLAKRLGVARSSCELIQGSKSRDKVIAVAGLKRGEAIDALAA